MGLYKFIVGLTLAQVNKAQKIKRQFSERFNIDGVEVAMDKVVEANVVYRQTHHGEQYVANEPDPHRW
jgi:hypothetical protein